MINILLNPKLNNRVYQDDETKELLEKTIRFFENKGKVKCKEDFHERDFSVGLTSLLRNYIASSALNILRRILLEK